MIGISHGGMTHYRQGRSLPNEKILAQLCALSGDDPGVIAAQIQAARSKSPEAKNLWMMIAARLSGAASTAILSVVFTISLIAGYAEPARAAGQVALKKAVTDSLYIVSITFLSVGCYLRDRHRQLPGVFQLISWSCSR